jgi:hypothetical protein
LPYVHPHAIGLAVIVFTPLWVMIVWHLPHALEHWLIFDYNYIIVIPSARTIDYRFGVVVGIAYHVAVGIAVAAVWMQMASDEKK